MNTSISNLIFIAVSYCKIQGKLFFWLKNVFVFQCAEHRSRFCIKYIRSYIIYLTARLMKMTGYCSGLHVSLLFRRSESRVGQSYLCRYTKRESCDSSCLRRTEFQKRVFSLPSSQSKGSWLHCMFLYFENAYITLAVFLTLSTRESQMHFQKNKVTWLQGSKCKPMRNISLDMKDASKIIFSRIIHNRVLKVISFHKVDTGNTMNVSIMSLFIFFFYKV